MMNRKQMSASIVKAHGGSKDLTGSRGDMIHLGMFVHNTKAGKVGAVHEAHLENVISQTTGIPIEKPVMDGVLTSTKQGAMDKDVPELHKVHHVGKTKAKRMGQVPYAGKHY